MEEIVIISKKNLSDFKGENGIYCLKIKPHKKEEALHRLAEWLHETYGEEILFQKISAYTGGMSSQEVNNVKRLALQEFSREKEGFVRFIMDSLTDLAEVSNFINLDGFTFFGMQEYRKEAEYLLEDCIEAYLSRESYREFLDLLHYFVELEESRLSQLYVVANTDGSYRFYDESYQEITMKCEQMFLDEFPEIDEEAEKENDMLISILVILVPEKIILYGIKNVKNKNFLITLQNIFQKRICFLEEVPQFFMQ
ncbi:MAG: hypothetical protein IJB80_02505 [Clostridia bacterium]|nr:hypothetical protein [Clostridia bacterium]